MVPLMVVVLTVLAEHRTQVTFRRDQHRVEAFAPAAADPSLGVGICSRGKQRRHDHLCAVELEDPVEAARELPIVIVDHQAELDPFVFEMPAEIPGLPSHPGCLALRCTAAARTRRVSPWTNMNTYSRLKNTVSTLKKSVATKVSAWAARNCCQVSSDRRPAGGTWARRRIERTVVAEIV